MFLWLNRIFRFSRNATSDKSSKKIKSSKNLNSSRVKNKVHNKMVNFSMRKITEVDKTASNNMCRFDGRINSVVIDDKSNQTCCHRTTEAMKAAILAYQEKTKPSTRLALVLTQRKRIAKIMKELKNNNDRTSNDIIESKEAIEKSDAKNKIEEKKIDSPVTNENREYYNINNNKKVLNEGSKRKCHLCGFQQSSCCFDLVKCSQSKKNKIESYDNKKECFTEILFNNCKYCDCNMVREYRCDGTYKYSDYQSNNSNDHGSLIEDCTCDVSNIHRTFIRNRSVCTRKKFVYCGICKYLQRRRICESHVSERCNLSPNTSDYRKIENCGNINYSTEEKRRIHDRFLNFHPKRDFNYIHKDQFYPYCSHGMSKSYESENLLYQGLSTYSDVMNELQQKIISQDQTDDKMCKSYKSRQMSYKRKYSFPTSKPQPVSYRVCRICKELPCRCKRRPRAKCYYCKSSPCTCGKTKEVNVTRACKFHKSTKPASHTEEILP